jgi:hypothetical protein
MGALLADLDDNGEQMRVDDDDEMPSDAEQEALPRHFFDDHSDDNSDLDLEDLAGLPSAATSTDAETDKEEEGESPASLAAPLHMHYGELAVELPKCKRQVVDQVTGRMLNVISAAAMCSEHAKQSSDRLVRVRQMKGKCVTK